MSDYIKREEALNALCDPCAYKSACYSGDEIPACPALWTMLNITAADVVERKSGEWGCERVDFGVMVAPGAYVIRSPTCSVCGYHAIDATNYCPNCGADMREAT